jgi:hypothetical protein
LVAYLEQLQVDNLPLLPLQAKKPTLDGVGR